MFVVHTSNCHGQHCTRRAIFRLGIDTLIANILVFLKSFIGQLSVASEIDTKIRIATQT